MCGKQEGAGSILGMFFFSSFLSSSFYQCISGNVTKGLFISA